MKGGDEPVDLLLTAVHLLGKLEAVGNVGGGNVEALDGWFRDRNSRQRTRSAPDAPGALVAVLRILSRKLGDNAPDHLRNPVGGIAQVKHAAPQMRVLTSAGSSREKAAARRAFRRKSLPGRRNRRGSRGCDSCGPSARGDVAGSLRDSGLRKAGVRRGSREAMPGSINLTFSLPGTTTMFPGLMSLWMMLARCTSARASQRGDGEFEEVPRWSGADGR